MRYCRTSTAAQSLSGGGRDRRRAGWPRRTAEWPSEIGRPLLRNSNRWLVTRRAKSGHGGFVRTQTKRSWRSKILNQVVQGGISAFLRYNSGTLSAKTALTTFSRLGGKNPAVFNGAYFRSQEQPFAVARSPPLGSLAVASRGWANGKFTYSQTRLPRKAPGREKFKTVRSNRPNPGVSAWSRSI